MSSNERPTLADCRRAIEAAFRQLPLLPNKDALLQSAVDLILSGSATRTDTARAPYTAVGPRKTKAELDRLIYLMEELADQLVHLHQPAIGALADAGLWRLRVEMPKNLQAIVKRVQGIDQKKMPAPPKGGRPANNCAHAIASIAALYYRLLTGKRPTRRFDPYFERQSSRGPFVELLGDIYAVLDLEVNAEQYARAAIARMRKEKTR